MSTSQAQILPAGPKKLKISQKWTELYLFQMKRIWKHLPESIRRLAVGQMYGRHLNARVRLHAERKQYFGTFFLRNRAELELMRRILDRKPCNSSLQIAVLACSKGAEVYSVVWTIRSARPDLKLRVTAVDIAEEIVEFGEKGIYSRHELDASDLAANDPGAGTEYVARNTCRDQSAPILERMTDQELAGMFELEGGQAKVRSWLKEGTAWLCGNAGDTRLLETVGPQDIVMANRFLCHMRPPDAEECLRNIARLVKPGGYLFVSGIDLDVRTKVAQEMGWKPVSDLIREVHEGDPSLLRGWPLEYWGLEPFRDKRPDWQIRYAAVFQIGSAD